MSSWGELSQKMKTILGLKWSPVAVKLVKKDEPLPKDIPKPRGRLRHCQSIMAARRGKTLLLTINEHGCPDGASVLGLMKTPEKIKRGELLFKVGEFASMKESKRIIDERPHLKVGDFKATVVAPLEETPFDPDVVVLTTNPEQAMWISCAYAYFTGERLTFSTIGYNACCVDSTVIPYLTGKINMSLGCYGCRGSTELSDNEVYVAIPAKLLPQIMTALENLSKKLIPETRRKIYLPPPP